MSDPTTMPAGWDASYYSGEPDMDKAAAALEEANPEIFDVPHPINDHVELSEKMRHLAVVRSRIDELERTAKFERDRIDHWLKDATEIDRGRAAELEGMIAAYALRVRAAGGEKSQTTAWGRVTTRELQPEFSRDTDVLLAWARDNGFTRTTESVDWAALRKAGRVNAAGQFHVDGELVPGVEVIPQSPSVKVEVSK